MNSWKPKPIKSLFTYPLTWVAVAFTALLHGLFTLIFRPPLFWTLVAFGADLAALALWFVFAFKSEAFKKRFNRMPYESKSRELFPVIRACSPAFRSPAEEAVRMIERINAEFPDQTYSAELSLMLVNIQDLAGNHRRLFERAGHFGDADQKKRMDKILGSQVEAMKNTLATLKTFSGNLTLLAANVEQSRTATNELKDLNQGLKEVIEEI